MDDYKKMIQQKVAEYLNNRPTQKNKSTSIRISG